MATVLVVAALAAGCASPDAVTGDAEEDAPTTSSEAPDAVSPTTEPTATPSEPAPTPDETASPSAGDPAAEPVPSAPAAVAVVDATTVDGVVSVNAYVSAVVEDGGACTATVSTSAGEVSGTALAFADATTTWCEPITVEAAAARPGDVVTVTYASPQHRLTGSSTVGSAQP